MISKKNRTLELYKTVGAEMRLLKQLFSRFFVDAGQLLHAKDCDGIYNLNNKLNHYSSELEKNMFNDYPGLTRDYIHVFYGNYIGKATPGIDSEIYAIANELINEFLKKMEDDI